MAVICAHCGEELLGSVNRCWKCGKPMLSTPDSAQAPPVRRSPVSLPQSDQPQTDQPQTEESDEPDSIDVSDAAEEIAKVADDEVVFAAEVLPASDEQKNTATPAPRAYSRAPASVQPGMPKSYTSRPFSSSTAASASRARFRQPGAIEIAALVSLFLGLLTMAAGGFFGWTLLFAIAGFAAGIWGIRSRWRSLAILGLLFCCFGTAIAGVRLAYDSFTWIYGEPPIQLFPEEPEYPGDGHIEEDY